MEPISITGMSSVSALGMQSTSIWAQYVAPEHRLYFDARKGFETFLGGLTEVVDNKLQELRDSDPKYKRLDRTVLMAILTARNAFSQVNCSEEFGVNFGSSRGATALFEKYHSSFVTGTDGRVPTLTSPTTTLGNIASWVGDDLQAKGPTISHSIACSTGLHALLNGVAWLRSGMSNAFLIGASEAANTAFTVAQMKALKIHSKATENDKYPCKALDFSKKHNTMVLGEGASALFLEKGIKENALAFIQGVGYATEPLEHNISISTDAVCFQKSMAMALKDAGISRVDAVVMHAPGTVKGDISEYKSLQKVFGENLPLLTTNKWKLGHTFATSGLLSMELAILMLQHQFFIPTPFLQQEKRESKLTYVMVNAVGFGGNAVSVIISSK
jgi:3-oxoacyl-[acyl-carrier-protein] synthase II